eukprot:4566007-Pyramimonas_sp.AAC.1
MSPALDKWTMNRFPPRDIPSTETLVPASPTASIMMSPQAPDTPESQVAVIDGSGALPPEEVKDEEDEDEEDKKEELDECPSEQCTFRAESSEEEGPEDTDQEEPEEEESDGDSLPCDGELAQLGKYLATAWTSD